MLLKTCILRAADTQRWDSLVQSSDGSLHPARDCTEAAVESGIPRHFIYVISIYMKKSKPTVVSFFFFFFKVTNLVKESDEI